MLSATYEARAYGVRSAMPMMRARRMCPHAVVLRPDFATYSEVSAGVMELFRTITPLVEPLSLDEAFLDVSGARRRLGTPVQIATWIRARVFDEQGITCSVGVAPTQVRRQAGLDAHCKPDGLLVVPARRRRRVPAPAAGRGAVGGGGEDRRGAAPARAAHGRRHRPYPGRHPAAGARRRGSGAHLSALSWGRDDRHVIPTEPDKSIGHEETFPRDVDDPAVVLRELLRLSERTAARLREQGYAAKTDLDQGALRRLHDDHPLADHPAARPTPAGTSTRSPATCSSRSGCSGPGCGWSGCAPSRLVPAGRRRGS